MTGARIKPPASRTKIEAALLELFAEGGHVNHDAVAERAGLSRRTVYRYFPDQNSMRQAMWHLLSPPVGMPKTLDGLLAGLESTFANFEAKAPAMTVAMASAEGRAMRNVMKAERVKAYRSILSDATTQLDEPDRTAVAAVIQLLASGFAWREMRDQWDMQSDQMGAAVGWAINTLLADIERRGSRPLNGGENGNDVAAK